MRYCVKVSGYQKVGQLPFEAGSRRESSLQNAEINMLSLLMTNINASCHIHSFICVLLTVITLLKSGLEPQLLWSWTCFKKNHIYLKMLCLYLIGEQSALLDDIALCSLTSSQNQLFSPLPWMALHLSFCLFLFAGPSP